MFKRRVASLCLAAFWVAGLAEPQETGPTIANSSSLDEFVRASLARNRDLLGVRQRVTEAQALMRQAGVRPAPNIEAEGATGRVFGSVGEEEFAAAYVQPVETAGKRAKRVSVAELSVALAESELRQRSTDLAYDIETAYLTVVYQRERVALLDRVLASLRDSSRLMEARVREGDAAPIEARLLTVELSRVEAQRIEAAGQQSAAELILRRDAGLSETDALPTLRPPIGKRTLSREELRQRALENRADLHSAQLLEQQGGAALRLAEAQARPDVNLSARYSNHNTRLDGQFGFTANGAVTPLHERYNTLSLGVALPLLTRRRNQGTIEASAAREAEARLHREHLERTIPYDVDAAYERWSAALRTRDTLRDGVVGPSDKNLTVIREAYQLGQLRLIDVLNEQRRSTDAELAYLEARVETARALAELERVSGGLLP